MFNKCFLFYMYVIFFSFSPQYCQYKPLKNYKGIYSESGQDIKVLALLLNSLWFFIIKMEIKFNTMRIYYQISNKLQMSSTESRKPYRFFHISIVMEKRNTDQLSFIWTDKTCMIKFIKPVSLLYQMEHTQTR